MVLKSRSITIRKLERQLGFTVIELMISLGLGAFLTLAVLQAFIGSKRSFDVIQAQAEMQESARFGMQFVRESLMMAGYINAGTITADTGGDFASSIVNIVDSEDVGESQWPAVTNFQAGAVVAGTDARSVTGLTDQNTSIDTLSIRYQGSPDAEIRDCEGRVLAASTTDVIELTYYVDNSDQLRCFSEGAGNNGNSSILVSGVENLAVNFGVATDENNPELVGKYISAADMTTDEWSNVVAVRLGLIAKSESSPLDTTAQQYSLLGDSVTTTADGKMRQVFSQTIALRNRLAE